MITNQSCCDAADNAHTTASREAPGSHIIDYLKSIDRTASTGPGFRSV
jgi:hypothetical protein